MSEGTSYVSEPKTNGTVLVETSFGQIHVELWSKECPLACRSFVQHCLNGYYDGCIFHRVIKGFMAQTGDPTGTGMGGESIYEEPFKDEFHQRLRFNRRGLLAMANENEPHTNGSQFFFTLGNCEWLAKKHTLFGKVTGETVFNVVKFDDVETDKDERPKYDPPKVIKIEVLHNPFPDIKRQPSAAEIQALKDAKKKKKKMKKNLSLLSFGEEQEELEEELTSAAADAGKSAHDLLEDDERLSKEAGDSGNKDKGKKGIPGSEASEDAVKSLGEKLKDDDRDEVAESISDRQKKLKDEQQELLRSIKEMDEEKKKPISKAKQIKMAKKEADAKRVRAFRVVKDGTTVDDSLLTKREITRKKYKKRSERTKNREKDVLAKLASFRQSLQSAPKTFATLPKKEDAEVLAFRAAKEEEKKKEEKEKKAVEETAKKKSEKENDKDDDDGGDGVDEGEKEETMIPRWLSDAEDSDEDPDDNSWMTHQVKFVKRPQDYDHMARNTDDYEYSIVDSRDPTAGVKKHDNQFAKARKNIDEVKSRQDSYRNHVEDNMADIANLDMDAIADRAEREEKRGKRDSTKDSKRDRERDRDRDRDRGRDRVRGRDGGRDGDRDRRDRDRDRDKRRKRD